MTVEYDPSIIEVIALQYTPTEEAYQEDWSSFGQADRSEGGSEDKTTVPDIVSPPVQGQCSIDPEQTFQLSWPRH